MMRKIKAIILRMMMMMMRIKKVNMIIAELKIALYIQKMMKRLIAISMAKKVAMRKDLNKINFLKILLKTRMAQTAILK